MFSDIVPPQEYSSYQWCAHRTETGAEKEGGSLGIQREERTKGHWGTYKVKEKLGLLICDLRGAEKEATMGF